MKTKHTLYVRSRNNQQEEWLTCANLDTFNLSHSVNDSTYQISFTAFLSDNTKVSFDLLQNETIVIFDGQQFVIKQCVEKYVDDLITKDITAMHIAYETQYFRQYQVNKGLQNYSINEMLQFIFDSPYNQGFNFDVNGSFDTISITDWGNASGLDALQKAIDSYGAIWIPDNKLIHVYDKTSYQKVTNKQYIWSHNTNDIELSVDSTSIQNAAMLYGATKEGDHTLTGDGEKISDATTGGGSNNAPATPTGGAIGTINTMEPGGAPVFNSPVGGVQTGRRLANGTDWQIGQQVTVNGQTWYQVSTHEWIRDDYVSFDKEGDKKPEEHTITQVLGQGTIKAADNTNSSDENHTAPTAANVYDSPWTPHQVTRQLSNGSRWIINSEVSNGADGKTWYQVSTNEWVCSDDFDFSDKMDVEPKPIEDNTSDSDNSDDETTQYVFEPFFYINSNSFNNWKLKIGADITNDQINDVQAMKDYADKTMQLDPIVQLSVLENTHEEAQIGDTSFLNADPIGIRTMITVNGITGNPFRKDSPMQLSLDNSMTAKKNVNYSMSDSVNLAHRNNELLRKTVIKLAHKVYELSSQNK